MFWKKREVLINTITSENYNQINISSVIRSELGIPIIKFGEVIAIFGMESEEQNAFCENINEILQPFCSLISMTLGSQDVNPDFIDTISRFREKQILILGKDTGDELERLMNIKSLLKTRGYEPLLVKDHPDIPELSNEEKVRLFADTSRFVILENSFPAGQIAEIKMCATNRIITASMRESGKGSSYMVTDYFKDFDFIKEFEYKDSVSIREPLERALNWAELKLQERREYYNSLYPWRQISKV